LHNAIATYHLLEKSALHKPTADTAIRDKKMFAFVSLLVCL
jgi:hypothetical protein